MTEKVSFDVEMTALGALAVTWTARGVCDVRLGESESEVETGLRERFPDATRAVNPSPWLHRVALACGGAEVVGVATDVEGTSFQKRVWNALEAIPIGETRTYSEVADSIGAPRAVRAVASACAANPVALVVPCHRVVRKGGSVSGYRWGSERKKALLSVEQGAN